jgi:osmotically-inducible protein OsmY
MARVERALQSLRVRIETHLWEDALDALAAGLAAVVLVLPVRKVASDVAVEVVRDHPNGRSVPVFCVIPNDLSSRQVRKLYRAGANVVLEWPRETEIFRSLFAESFGITRVRGRAPEADKALAHSARAHLRIFPELDPGRLRLFARDGLLSVSGQARSLAQRDQVVETLAKVPGVKAVVAESLRVRPGNVSDRTLKNRISRILREVPELDEATVLVEVRNGHVTLRGTARDRRGIQRLETLIMNLDGPRGLDTRIEVSPDRQRTDSRQTRRYRKAIETLYPKEKVSLSFIDGAAVLGGVVRSLSTKRSIARLLQRDAATRSVVNKIRVE